MEQDEPAKQLVMVSLPLSLVEAPLKPASSESVLVWEWEWDLSQLVEDLLGSGPTHRTARDSIRSMRAGQTKKR